jgi:twitching motility protein PilT
METRSFQPSESEFDPSTLRKGPGSTANGSPSDPASRLGRAPSRSAAIAAENSGLPQFCTSIAESAPSVLYGEDRIQYLLDRLSQIDIRDRMRLRTFFDQFVNRMSKINASDLDLGGPTSTGLIWYRIDGDKRPDLSLPRFSVDECTLLILGIMSANDIKSLKSERSADFSYELPAIAGMKRKRFRSTVYMDMGTLALNMRAITDELRPLKSLAFHPSVEKGLMFRHVRDGLTLITGVTGSGKSSTLDAIVDANNEDINGHIVVIGKPIEYVHESKKCIVRHREVGADVLSFKDGIVQALRQDPDIVVIGEMRDPATISSALEITDSGHKVFSTLHTSSAVESIDRIIAEYPPAEQDRIRFRLAEVLRCIVSQKLLPKVGGGRILAKEVLWMTSSASAAIKNNNTDEIYQMMYEGWNVGQITLEQDLYRLMRQGLITPETAMNHANNKRRFQQLVK